MNMIHSKKIFAHHACNIGFLTWRRCRFFKRRFDGASFVKTAPLPVKNPMCFNHPLSFLQQTFQQNCLAAPLLASPCLFLPLLAWRSKRMRSKKGGLARIRRGCFARSKHGQLRSFAEKSVANAKTSIFKRSPSVEKPNPILLRQHKSNKTSQYNFRIAFKNRLIPTEYSLETFHRSNQDTCLLHNPAVSEGDWVQSGDLLADCAASSGGELSLGKNILVAYMPWEGYNFEDAILISERLVFEDVYSSIHIERYDTEIRDTKDGMEIITRDIPELNTENLDTNGIAKLGSWVKEGDVLVGRVTPIKAKVQSTYKKLLNTILQTQTKPELKRDSSLRAPRGMKGKIVNVQIDWLTLKPKKVIKMVYVYLAEKRKIQVGDKMAGRHGNKGIVSQVLPRQDMPFLANGTPIDMVLNPLGVPSRMNVGQIYECLLGLAAKYLGEHYKIFPFDERYGPEASRSFVYSKLYEARKKTGSNWLFDPNCPGKTRLFDGRTGDPFDQSVTVGYAYMLKLVHLVDDKIHCLTPDHDILTSEGWLKISEVNCSHKIATLTQKGGTLVYQNPSEVLHYKNYSGDLYHIKNANIDLLVTLDHRMWVKRGLAPSPSCLAKQARTACFPSVASSVRSKKGTAQQPKGSNGPSFDDYQLIEAQKIKGKHRKYLKTANWVKDDYQFVLPAIISNSVPMPEKTVDMKAWLTFFGLWIAEGCFFPGATNNISKRPAALRLNLSEEEKMLLRVFSSPWGSLSKDGRASLKTRRFCNNPTLASLRALASPSKHLLQKRGIFKNEIRCLLVLPSGAKQEGEEASTRFLLGETSTRACFAKQEVNFILGFNIAKQMQCLLRTTRNKALYFAPHMLRELKPSVLRTRSTNDFSAEKSSKNSLFVAATFQQKQTAYQVQTRQHKPRVPFLLGEASARRERLLRQARAVLEGAVSTLGYSFSIINQKLTIHDKQLWSYLRPFSLGVSNQFLPSWVWDLSQEQARMLIHSMVLSTVFQGPYASAVKTDGTTRKDSINYYTSSVKLADDIMRLALHAGWSGNKYLHLKAGNVGGIIGGSRFVRSNPFRAACFAKQDQATPEDGLVSSPSVLLASSPSDSGTSKTITSNFNIWRISIIKGKNNPAVNHSHVRVFQQPVGLAAEVQGRTSFAEKSSAKTKDQNVQIEKIIPYKGSVYCLSVPNEVFYVRRNGKPVWTGNSRSTGPYSLVTQQPLRGRSKQGGQRLGEMEVWALEGYGAAFTLLEMLTIKSDDMTGRMTLWSRLILNKDLSIGTPESFKVLVCELQALCLDIGIFRMDSASKLVEIEKLSELP